jgi:translation initiation factor 1 (eIF-1/SUI1)
VVEGAALEKRCAGNGTVGSNPTLSAKQGDYYKWIKHFVSDLSMSTFC